MDYYEEDMEEDFEPQYEVTYDGDSTVYHHLARDGLAKAKFLNGDEYHGEYRNGKRCGRGVYTYISGAIYDGEYRDGKKEGTGKFTYPDGSTYEGEFKADKREGHGKYTYANSEEYEGQWRGDVKHGPGVYRYANKTTLTGVWGNGSLMHGQSCTSDGTTFTGSFLGSTPQGPGFYAFPSGLTLSGGYDDSAEWRKDPFAKPAVVAKAPAPAPAPEFKVACRLVDKAVYKADQFESTHALRKKPLAPGAPNLRQAAPLVVGGESQDSHVFACSQPTLPGLRAAVEVIQDRGFSHVLLVSTRDAPCVYVNDLPIHPRDRRQLNARLALPTAGMTAEERALLDERFAHRVRKDVAWRGNELVYFTESFAVDAGERKNAEGGEPVADAARVLPLQAAVELLAEEEGLPIEFVRAPLPGNAAPSAAAVDALLDSARDAGDATALLFVSRTGRQRATLGAVLALLTDAAMRGINGGEEEEEGYDGDDDDEHGGEQARAAREAAANKPEYDPAAPDYRRGQYSAVMRLVELMPSGVAVKRDVDKAINQVRNDTDNCGL